MTNTNNKMDAIDLLEADHREMEFLFDSYGDTKMAWKKYEIARILCSLLLIHMEVEETIFYPAAYTVTGDHALTDELQSERAGARDIIAKLSSLSHSAAEFDDLVQQLQIETEHHIDKEEMDLFFKVRESDLDTMAIGRKLLKMKIQLLEAHSMLEGA